MTFLIPFAGEGKDIELRHQRNPDVLFDCVRKQEGQCCFLLPRNPFQFFSQYLGAWYPALPRHAAGGCCLVCVIPEGTFYVGQVTGVPEEAFVAIETLLPTGKDKFLELYAPIGAGRPGWTHVAQRAEV